MISNVSIGVGACKVLRMLAFIWRLRDLRLAEFIHQRITKGLILERPFFGYRLMLDVSRTSYHAMLYLRGERAIDERFILSSVIKNGDCILDVGANIGYYALMLARIAGRNGKVVCFEPEPDNLIELKRNAERNDLRQVSVLAKAVGSESQVVGIGAGMNGHVVKMTDSDSTVEMCTLDDAVKDRVDFIKIDVEGYEWEVLKGAKNIVSLWKPRMFIEVHPHLLPANSSVATIIDYLEKHFGSLEYYEEYQSSRFKRFLERYSNRVGLRCVSDPRGMLSRLAAGEKLNRFWVLCKSE